MPPVLAGGIGDVVAGWLCGGVDVFVVAGGEGWATVGEAGELAGVECGGTAPDGSVEGGSGRVGRGGTRRGGEAPGEAPRGGAEAVGELGVVHVMGASSAGSQARRTRPGMRSGRGAGSSSSGSSWIRGGGCWCSVCVRRRR